MNPCSSTHSPFLPAHTLGITFLEDIGGSKPGGAGARGAAGELGVHFVVDWTAGAWGAAHVGIVVGFCLGKQGGRKALVKIPATKGNTAAVNVSPALRSSIFPSMHSSVSINCPTCTRWQIQLSAWIRVYWTANNYIFKKTQHTPTQRTIFSHLWLIRFYSLLLYRSSTQRALLSSVPVGTVRLLHKEVLEDRICSVWGDSTPTS